ncbi:hypothetical protein [Aquidulcibacter sp.]|uniref:hypothetical protein n=1 Tax=Aquidulcibacter sp. TaxID=2052990 RepID=UPI0025BB106F|nr:hypothetical protein [Aquidulcibacter sp.]MCA3692430.1 hypothetical protein [Aquidulcibacter sp.]
MMASLWRRWVIGWCYLVLALGLVFTGSAWPQTDAAVRLFYDVIYWPLDGQSGWHESLRLTAAILGAVMMGWALTLLTLVQTALKHPQLSLWRPMTGAILVWWVVDSSISVALNTPGNALSNTGFLLLYLIPVLASGVLKKPNQA